MGDTPTRVEDLLCTLADSTADGATYCVEGTVNAAGAAFAWAERHWDLRNLTEHLHRWPAEPDNQPVFLNTVVGLGSPFWRQGPPPALLAPDGTAIATASSKPPADTDPVAIAAAIAESILFLLHANLDRIRRAIPTIQQIQISGGLSNPAPLCQRLADLTGLPVQRAAHPEATAQGATRLAVDDPIGRAAVPIEAFFPQPNPQLRQRNDRFTELLGQR